MRSAAHGPAARSRDRPAIFTRLIAEELDGHGGYRAIQAIPGVGPTFAAILVAEIGDVHRFPAPAALRISSMPPRAKG